MRGRPPGAAHPFNRHHRPVSTIMELGKLAICSLAANVVSIGVSMALAVLHHKWRVDDRTFLRNFRITPSTPTFSNC